MRPRDQVQGCSGGEEQRLWGSLTGARRSQWLTQVVEVQREALSPLPGQTLPLAHFLQAVHACPPASFSSPKEEVVRKISFLVKTNTLYPSLSVED